MRKNEEHANATINVAQEKMSKKTKDALKTSIIAMNETDIIPLVREYYQWQGIRIAEDNQIRSINQRYVESSSDENISAMEWLATDSRRRESQIKDFLQAYVESKPVGRWLMATRGIGPVIAAALLAYMNLDKAKGPNSHPGDFWSYCGLNDHNNPWLSKEQAKKSVKEIFDIVETRTSRRLAVFTSKIGTTKERKEIFKVIKETVGIFYDRMETIVQMTIDADYETDNFTEEEFSQFIIFKNTVGPYIDKYMKNDIWVTDEGKDKQFVSPNLADLMVHIVHPNAVTDEVISMVMAKHNRHYRSIVNGLNYLKKKPDDDPYKKWKDSYSKDGLEKYLSKVPYSQDMKVLCYKIGDSFVKQSNKGSLYGRLYKERKAQEMAKNEAGEYANYARVCLERRKGNGAEKTLQTYHAGKLPDIQIERRARRYAVQIFISHVFEAMYIDKYGKYPADIYTVANMENHQDYIGPENDYFDFIKKPE